MSIPNIQQQLYLKKALNENTDGIFDHEIIDEGSYVHSKGELKKAIKGSKRNIVKALKRGNKKDAEFWMQNKKDAESQMSESITEGLLRRYQDLKEGSRGRARHERIVNALKKKSAALWGSTRGMKPSDPGYREARAAEEAQPKRRERIANYNRLARDQQGRDRVQISRERRRAGLGSQIPSSTVNMASVDDTGTWRVKSEPVSQHPDLQKRFKGTAHAPARVPKKVLKYRETSAAKKAAGIAAKKGK